MQLYELMRGWLTTEFPDLELWYNEHGPVSEIVKTHKDHRLTFIVAYIIEDAVVFGPWDSVTKVFATDPNFFDKVKQLIKDTQYNEPYQSGKPGFKTM